MPEIQPTRILIVDSSALSREILTRILRDELPRTEVITAESAENAIEVLQTHKFDVITTALMLSDMDGLTLSRTIRDSHDHHYTPIIVVSGDADNRLLREGFEAGVTDYFDKSKGYKAFGSFIKSFLQRHSGLTGHILFIEDSRTSTVVTEKMLEKHGLTFTHTTSAEEAFRLLEQQHDDPESGEHSFDMVITDFYTIGDMTGGDLLHGIRAKFHLSHQELPVLVLTSADDEKTQADIFHAGANDFVAKPIVEEILIARVRAQLLIKHQFDAIKRQTEAMRWVAVTDSLTGVRSRRYLVDNGQDFINNPDNQPVWAIIIDLDHFKKINDSHGHITGDHVLAAMGDLLNRFFPDDMVIRFGGEEFCILAKNYDRTRILKTAEKLRRKVEELEPVDVPVTISIGIAGTNDHPNLHISEFLTLADRALYQAKDNGRNQVCIATPKSRKTGDEPKTSSATP